MNDGLLAARIDHCFVWLEDDLLLSARIKQRAIRRISLWRKSELNLCLARLILVGKPIEYQCRIRALPGGRQGMSPEPGRTWISVCAWQLRLDALIGVENKCLLSTGIKQCAIRRGS